MTQIPPREVVRKVVEEVLRETTEPAGPAPACTPCEREGWELPSRYQGRPDMQSRPRRVLRAPAEGIRVAIGSDHGGFDLKRQLCELLVEQGFVPVDVGTHSRESCDYPDFARAVGQTVRDGQATWGIMIDGAGIGSAMVLNKMPGIRAATVHSEATAINSRAHNDANVLVLGSAQMHAGHARRITRIWLQTPHEGGRHARRVEKINALDQERIRRGGT